VPVTESLIMQETRKLSTLKVSKGISVWQYVIIYQLILHSWTSLVPELLIIWLCFPYYSRKLAELADQGEAKYNYNYSIPFYPYQTILGGRRCHSEWYKSANPCSSKAASRKPGNFSFLW
jgi:hypothetical protein